MIEPDWVRRLNYHEFPAGSAQNLISIELNELIRLARLSTNLSDFGDNLWEEYLDDYIYKLNSLDQLHVLGRIRVKASLLNGLRNRLLITEYLKNKPEIEREPVNQPVIIIGLPRTGTTILFSLLSLDPQFRSPLGFETSSPTLSAENTKYKNSEPYYTAECLFDFEMDIHKEIRAMHDHRGDLPVECQSIMNNVLALFYTEIIGDSEPSYRGSKFMPDYHWHKKVLQILQYNNCKKRWLLKCPSHINSIGNLLDVYPNSLIIHTHRNPTSVFPSCAKLLKYLTDSHCAPDNYSESFESFINVQEAGLRNTIHKRETSAIQKSLIHDVYFDDLLKKPTATLEGIYKKFDITFTEQHRNNILNYLTDNPRYSKGNYSYSYEEFGLSKERIIKQFKFYTDYYSIPSDQMD